MERQCHDSGKERFLLDFEREWKSEPSAIAVMTPEAYQSFVSHGLPMRVLSQSEDRVVVIKPD